jgi:hypothetical protein
MPAKKSEREISRVRRAKKAGKVLDKLGSGQSPANYTMSNAFCWTIDYQPVPAAFQVLIDVLARVHEATDHPAWQSGGRMRNHPCNCEVARTLRRFVEGAK